MDVYVHALTPTEAACGVTLEDVARELPRGLYRSGIFHVDANLPPALAESTARAAFSGGPVEYIGKTAFGRGYVRAIL